MPETDEEFAKWEEMRVAVLKGPAVVAGITLATTCCDVSCPDLEHLAFEFIPPDGGIDYMRIVCLNCDLQADHANSEAEAANKWNLLLTDRGTDNALD